MAANVPNRSQTYLLEPDEDEEVTEIKKVTWVRDKKVPDAAVFRINKEDHTLGNVVRCKVLEDDRVLFVGYKVPHPLKSEVVIKVRTQKRAAKPREVVLDACSDLLAELDSLENEFRVAASQIQPGIQEDSFNGVFLQHVEQHATPDAEDAIDGEFGAADAFMRDY
ncbi:MAG: hypothetical protein MHM6MM_000006 [Cercozoa sp. M6MM]